MKITTLDEHGKEVNEKDYGNLAPKCYLEFNPSQPIFTIEEDELNIINSKSISLKKTILENQFRAAFEIDYSLFLDSEYNKYRNIEQTYSSLLQDKIIESVDKELSVLIKICSKYDYKPSKLSACASEILLSDSWLDVLLYHALMSSKRNRNAKDTDSARLKSFLNLLSRYYYALKRQFEMGNLGVRAEEQLTILGPYIYLYKSLYRRPIGLDNRFYERLLFSLHVSNYKNKCVHYNLIALIEQLAGATTKDMCYLKITDLRKTHTPNKYDFSLSDYDHKEHYVFSLTDEEIASFRIQPSVNEALEDVSNLLYDIYSEHLKANKEKFEKEVQSDYEDYCIANETTDWQKYRSYYKDKIRQRASDKKATDPEECYYEILFSYDTLDGLLSIRDKNIIADLFALLILNNDKDQYPLFKGIICLNYIKQKIGIKGDLVSKAVQDALEYIKPIYCDRLYVAPQYQDKIKTIIDEFFNMQQTKCLITETHPRTFAGGFNLELVYNFIGLLRSRGIINIGGDSLDHVFKVNAKTDDPSGRKKYIVRWNKVSDILIGDYLKAVEALVDKYVDIKK